MKISVCRPREGPSVEQFLKKKVLNQARMMLVVQVAQQKLVGIRTIVVG